MNKMMKVTIVFMLCISLLSLMEVSTKAVSLSESFYSSTDYSFVKRNDTGGDVWKKTVRCGTKKYNKKHYVRAYIGGTKNSAAGAVSDSGRVWGSGDIQASASQKATIFDNLLNPIKTYFKIGYTKYGS